VKLWPGNASQEKTAFGGMSRSSLMSRIRSSQNQTTELRLIALLRNAEIHGWRRNYHLPGKPDFVFLNAKLAVFVDGCFWHGHDCGRNLRPKRNAVAWRTKIDGNRRRDRLNGRVLRAAGWSVCRIWECSLAKQPAACLHRIKRMLKWGG
jgi:DNA mismatch endonuclease (patch repair protein)